LWRVLPATPLQTDRRITEAVCRLRPAERSSNLDLLCCIPRGKSMNWSAEAEAKLKEIPFFVRPAVRRRIESLAADAGHDRVDLLFFEEAKAQFGQK